MSGKLPAGFAARALSQPGKQYAIYLHKSSAATQPAAPPPAQSLEISLLLQPGTYRTQWMDPITGKSLDRPAVKHSGGPFTIAGNIAQDAAVQIVMTDP
jgi:hypothetical protein